MIFKIINLKSNNFKNNFLKREVTNNSSDNDLADNLLFFKVNLWMMFLLQNILANDVYYTC